MHARPGDWWTASEEGAPPVSYDTPDRAQTWLRAQRARQIPHGYRQGKLDDFRLTDVVTTSLVYFAKPIQLVLAFPGG